MSLSQQVTKPRHAESIAVWDPIVRWGHWGLVAGFTLAYLSAEEEGASPAALHVWGGYVVAAIVLVRVVWGFVGPQHARFSDFVYRPASAMYYFIGLLRGKAQRYIGHSPAGGIMVLALLVSLAATVTTGWIAYNNPEHTSQASNRALVIASPSPNGGPENRNATTTGRNEAEGAIAELHGTLANITLALVIMHVLGVGLASFVHRENLVGAMVTGKKSKEQ